MTLRCLDLYSSRCHQSTPITVYISVEKERVQEITQKKI